MPKRDIPWGRMSILAVLVAAVIGLILVVRGGRSVPDTVQPIEWSRQACAHCQMLIGDPRHAAQLVTTSGEVHSFDDPGCALAFLEQRRPVVHRLWFHDSSKDRWLLADEVGFLTGGTTPMASGLLAVERGTAAAIDVAAARRMAMTPSPGARGADAAPEMR